MKFIICTLLALSLMGCATTIVEKEYIVRTASQELKELPNKDGITNAVINTDADAAKWLAEIDKYINLLEGKFKNIIVFYERPVDK